MAEDSFLLETLKWLGSGVAMALVMGALSRGRDKARPAAGEFPIAYPRAILVLAVVGIAFFLALAVVSATAEDGWEIALIFCPFVLLSMLLMLDYYRLRHRATAEDLRYGTRFGGRQALAWSQVTRVR